MKRVMEWSTDDLMHRLGLSTTLALPHIRRPHPHNTIVLTGATGWLGRHILAQLCQDLPTAHIIAPVRAKDLAHAQQRLRAVLGNLWNEHTANHVHACLPTDNGNTFVWDHVPLPPHTSVDSVIHCAADLSLAHDLDAAWSTNVGMTQALWKWAQDHNVGRFDHISTLSVFVASNAPYGEVCEDDGLEKAVRLYGGYAASKWCAEAWLMHEASHSNTALAIHRPGLLSYSRTQGWAPNDGVCAWAQAWRAWGQAENVVWAGNERVDFTPCEYVAQGVVRSIQEGSCGVHHWANASAVPARVWEEHMRKRYGPATGHWPRHTHLGKQATRALGRALNVPQAHKYWWHDLFQSTNHTYNTSHAQRLCPCPQWTHGDLTAALNNLPPVHPTDD